MVHTNHPTSLDISNDDYSLEISCTQENLFFDEKSTPSTRFPHIVMLRFLVETVLVSSSDPNNRVTYQCTKEEIWMLSSGLFSCRCGDLVKTTLDIVHIPFSLCQRNIDWIGVHGMSDCEGRFGISLHRKLLQNLPELVSEVVRYIQTTLHHHCLPLERTNVTLHIKKLVSQPARVISLWSYWYRTRMGEYHEFVHAEPMRYLLTRWMANLLENRRQQQGEFDPEEICCICMEGLSENEGADPGGVVVTRLLCSHVFHESCISGWLNVRASCPCCRTDVGY